MGICASCLGLNRRRSQTADETDPLLDSSHQAQYEGAGGEDVAQPDEEELRREREALEHITAEAAENMIDVSHPSPAELSQQYARTNHERYTDPDSGVIDGAHDASEPEDAEEAAWLQSIQSSDLDSANEIKDLQSGALVMDISQLREDPPLSSAKKALKSAIR